MKSPKVPHRKYRNYKMHQGVVEQHIAGWILRSPHRSDIYFPDDLSASFPWFRFLRGLHVQDFRLHLARLDRSILEDFFYHLAMTMWLRAEVSAWYNANPSRSTAARRKAHARFESELRKAWGLFRGDPWMYRAGYEDDIYEFLEESHCFCGEGEGGLE